MQHPQKKAGTVAAVPGLEVTRVLIRATPQYPLSMFGSNELAARVIGERFRLSPTVARTVVELVGYGRRA